MDWPYPTKLSKRERDYAVVVKNQGQPRLIGLVLAVEVTRSKRRFKTPSMQGENIAKKGKIMVLELDGGEKLTVMSWLTAGSKTGSELGAFVGE